MIRRFGDHLPQIASGAWVDPSAQVIGKVWIGPDSSVWPCAVLRGDVHEIHLGARSNVQDNAVLHVTHDGPYCPGGRALTIGDDVTIGHGAILHACAVGNTVLIGMRAVVLDGAIIEDQVMLAAGAVVAPGKRLEKGHLYRGQPAVMARPLTDSELTFLRYSAAQYVKLACTYATDE